MFFTVRRKDATASNSSCKAHIWEESRTTHSGLRKKQIGFRVIVSKVLLKQSLGGGAIGAQNNEAPRMRGS